MKLIITYLLIISVYNFTIYDLYFLKAENFLFNEEISKWQFIIKYSADKALADNIEYTVSILSDDNPSLAFCFAYKKYNENHLNCTCKNEERNNLIALNKVPGDANIHWKNLTWIYRMPVCCNLIYQFI